MDEAKLLKGVLHECRSEKSLKKMQKVLDISDKIL